MNQNIKETTRYVDEGQEEVTFTCDFWPSISTQFYVDGTRIEEYQEGTFIITYTRIMTDMI